VEAKIAELKKIIGSDSMDKDKPVHSGVTLEELQVVISSVGSTPTGKPLQRPSAAKQPAHFDHSTLATLAVQSIIKRRRTLLEEDQ